MSGALVQNRPDLYKNQCGSVPPGVYGVRIGDVREVQTVYGPRLVVLFLLPSGEGVSLSMSQRPSSTGRLCAVLRGLTGREPTRDELHDPRLVIRAGIECFIVVRTAIDGDGGRYPKIDSVSR